MQRAGEMSIATTPCLNGNAKWCLGIEHFGDKFPWILGWKESNLRSLKMIAVDLADLIGAVPRRRSVWAAICPKCAHLSLQIVGGRYDIADVRCIAGCSIYQIVPALGISWDEFTSRPIAPAPDLGEMDDSETRAYYKSERERQAKHKAACEQIERCREDLASLKRKVRIESARPVPSQGCVLSESDIKLEQTRQKLKLARRQEKNLRA